MGEVEEEEAVAAAAACECCGFTQECTATYMAAVRARYGGRWICGLCGDAVGEELAVGRRRRRSCGDQPVSPGEALDRHAAVCHARRASAPPSPDGDLIAAVRVLLLRRLASPSSPRRVQSTPNSPRHSGGAGELPDNDDVAAAVSAGVALARTGSCFAALLE